MSSSKLMLAAVAASVLLGSTMLAAHDTKGKRSPISDYRHNVMEQVKYSYKSLGLFARGLQIEEEQAIKWNLMNLHHAAKMTKSAFKEDTRGKKGETDSLDAIWENWDDFAEKSDAFDASVKAAEDAYAAGGMDALKPMLRKIGSQCKACHDDYRKKDH